jgi:hypothetical protein
MTSTQLFSLCLDDTCRNWSKNWYSLTLLILLFFGLRILFICCLTGSFYVTQTGFELEVHCLLSAEISGVYHHT